jgi:hypothetical protein
MEKERRKTEILTVADIPLAIINKANRVFFEESSLGFGYITTDEIEVLVYDADGLSALVVSPDNDVSNLLEGYEANPGWFNDFWDLKNNTNH